MKLALGTVQFGMDYGISNQAGQCSQQEVAAILKLAQANDILTLDTAAAYGDSQKVLGELISTDSPFKIVTKLAHIKSSEQVKQQFAQSLALLNCATIYGLLIHHAEDLLSEQGEAIWQQLQTLQAERLVKKIGVSVYDADQIDAILDRYAIDLIQVPVSVFDQRLIESGHLTKLKELGVEIHARSVFLQGLVFMQKENLPEYFTPAVDQLLSFYQFCDDQGIARAQAALGFVERITEIDKVVVGVSGAVELSELIDASLVNKRFGSLKQFAVNDIQFLNPTNWVR